MTTCVLSSVSHASTRMASASEHPSLTAASCVGDVACAASGMTLISCSRTALECETRTSPGFRSDKDWGFVSFGTTSVWAVLAIRAVPFRTGRADRALVARGETARDRLGADASQRSTPFGERRSAPKTTSSCAWSCAIRVNWTRNSRSALASRSVTAQSDCPSGARSTAPVAKGGEAEGNACRCMATSPISSERMPEVRMPAVLKRTPTTGETRMKLVHRLRRVSRPVQDIFLRPSRVVCR